MDRRNIFKGLAAAGISAAFPVAAPPTAQPSDDADTALMAQLRQRGGAWGFNLAGMDTSVRPGDDFFRYANGKAVDAMVIPASLPYYNAWERLADLSEVRVKRLIIDLAKRSDLSGDEIKIRDLYQSLIDTSLRNRLDISPVAPVLRRLAAIRNRSEMARRLGETNRDFGRSLFNIGVGNDPGQPGTYVVRLSQGGLGLDRDYYLSETYADKKAAYEVYIGDMLRAVAWPDAVPTARAVVAFETAVAQASWSRVESRDATKTYNPMTYTGLAALAPGFDWDAYFKGANLRQEGTVIVNQLSAFSRLTALYNATPLETLKAWQVIGLLGQAAPHLCDRIRLRDVEFYSRTMWGIEEPREDWQRAVVWVGNMMGEAVGRAYVAAHFSPSTKASAVALVDNLLAAMKARIENLTWMSEATRAEALAKLNQVGVKIGYPDTWRDYSGLDIRADDLYGNVERWYKVEWQRQLHRIGKPVDRAEWSTTPQTSNAFYSPLRNDITFPAAILQPPFFDPEADPAVNYGAIGAVIGHEITHAFDSQGRRYDGEGRLRDWWTATDDDNFTIRATAFGAQYAMIEPLPGLKVDAKLTMAENIADLGGMEVGLDAYHRSLQGKPAPVIDGFTGDQRFFLGWAQIWAGRQREDYLKNALVLDAHAPDAVRTVVPARNIDAWYDAFNIQPQDKNYLAPADRVHIW